jgi:cell fate regulator YaaT (PSP1 superfamily)
MAKTAATRPKQGKYKKFMLVRYGLMDTLGWFEHNEAHITKEPARVVIKTDRGLELGHLVGQLCPYKAGHFRWNQDQVKQYFDNSEVDYSWGPVGRFVRYATAEDLSEERHLEKIAREEMDYCIKSAKELGIKMKIVDSEHVFGGERIVFYFMSDGRVDFRQLVKKLAREYQTRIEMRQIGSRDEAKLLADFESCGQQCCCKRFLKALKPVSMRMAKMQKATLDPSKISGYCGRLKCCLRYEDQNYTELKKRLPRKNTVVKTKQGQGRVINSQILTQLVIVEIDSGSRIAVPLEEIEIVPQGKGSEKPQEKKGNNSNQKKQQNQNKQRNQSKPNKPDRQNKPNNQNNNGGKDRKD